MRARAGLHWRGCEGGPRDGLRAERRAPVRNHARTQMGACGSVGTRETCLAPPPRGGLKRARAVVEGSAAHVRNGQAMLQCKPRASVARHPGAESQRSVSEREVGGTTCGASASGLATALSSARSVCGGSVSVSPGSRTSGSFWVRRGVASSPRAARRRRGAPNWPPASEPGWRGSGEGLTCESALPQVQLACWAAQPCQWCSTFA